MDTEGRMPDGTWHALVAFCFTVLLVTVALWPNGSSPDMALPDQPYSASTRQEYQGPVTAEEVYEHCFNATAAPRISCYRSTLQQLVVARGANHTFDVLEQLNSMDAAVSGQGHSIAHDLGRAAYAHFGDIRVTLQTCSYKMFQGCLHGALETYLSSLPAIEPHHLNGLCAVEDSTLRSLCVHGIGHGLLLYTNYRVNRSLGLCDFLQQHDQQQSCYSGVIMENLVGWSQSRNPGHEHHHAHDEEPEYLVQRAGDPYFPCSVLQPRYQPECWKQQVDYILYMNGGNFRDAAQKCDEAPAAYVLTCYASMGRDASGWFRNVTRTVEYCSYGEGEKRNACIRGMADEIVLHYFTSEPAIEACKQVPEQDKAVCYQTTGSRGATIQRDRMAEICSLAESAYVNACRSGAGLPPLESSN